MALPVAGPYQGKDLERLAAAAVASRHLYVDRGLEFPDICEADVIGTRFGPLDRFLLEVKSGADVGVRDMFAFESHSRYLASNHSGMLVPTTAKVQMSEVARWGSIDLMRCDLGRADVVLAVNRWLGGAGADFAVAAWERGFYVEEKLYQAVRAARPTRPATATAWTRYLDVHRPSWARRGIAQRSDTAYGAFQQNPHGAEAHAREIDGTVAPVNSTALQDAIRLGSHPSVLGVLLLEWSNRLEVVRLMCEFSAAGLDPDAAVVSIMTLPAAFKQGVAAIRADLELQQVMPHVLQAFVYCWGGFLVDNADLAAFASDVGVSTAVAERCLQMVDVVFPRPGGAPWLMPAYGARWLVLVPFPVQGNGVLHRDAARPGWFAALPPGLPAQLISRRDAATAILSS